MKIALILAGHLRTFDETLLSLNKSIIDNYNPDIYISTWDDQDFSRHNKKITQNYSFSELENIPNLKDISIEKYFKDGFHDRFLNESLHSDNYFASRTLSMYYKIYKSFTLLKTEYDVIIRTRPDIYYYDELDLSNFDFSKMNIPNSGHIPRIDLSINDNHNLYPNLPDKIKFGTVGTDGYFIGEPSDCGCIMDVFSISNMEEMRKYCDLYNRIPEYINEGQNYSPECLLSNHLNKMQIKINRFDYKIYILRNWDSL